MSKTFLNNFKIVMETNENIKPKNMDFFGFALLNDAQSQFDDYVSNIDE